MINVAHVVEDLKIGGLERVIENISMHLNTEKFRVFALCLSRGGKIAERLTANGKDVEILGIKNYHNPLSIIKVVKWFGKNRIDIVHTHGYAAGVLGRAAAIIAGTRYVFHHIHTTYPDLNKRNYLIERILGGFTKNVICCSGAVENHAGKTIGISEKKLITLYNGIPEPDLKDSAALDNLKQSLGIPENSVIIGCVASLVPHKGHRYLIEAVKNIDNAHLVLVGGGNLKKELESMADNHGIKGRVIFTGCQIDVTPFVQIMDIFVLPSSEREGLGMSVIEAMAMGKPVIVTAIGGLPEVVSDGETGIIVEAKNSKALASAISKLSAAPDIRERMGAKGKERYKKMFSLNYMLNKMENLYEEY